MKISGFAYYSKLNWEYPYDDVLPYIEKIVKAFGAERMLWGSDYPPTMRYMTYRQSLEVVRTHCTFLTEESPAFGHAKAPGEGKLLDAPGADEIAD